MGESPSPELLARGLGPGLCLWMESDPLLPVQPPAPLRRRHRSAKRPPRCHTLLCFSETQLRALSWWTMGHRAASPVRSDALCLQVDPPGSPGCPTSVTLPLPQWARGKPGTSTVVFSNRSSHACVCECMCVSQNRTNWTRFSRVSSVRSQAQRKHKKHASTRKVRCLLRCQEGRSAETWNWVEGHARVSLTSVM